MRSRLILAAFGMVAAIAGCGKPSTAPQTLASVAPLPAPAVPPWIRQIAPLGTVKNRAQIRILFSSAVLPVAQLGSAQEREVLSHVQIAPQLPGAFVVLTPRMVAFQADHELPAATRVRVTLTSGLHDLQGHRLDRDLAWTFATAPLRFSLPQDAPTPGTISRRPVIRVATTAQIDLGSFAQHAAFVSRASGSVAATAVLESPQPDSGAIYDVSAQNELRAATSYRLMVQAGVMPAGGNMPSDTAFEVPVKTYSPLAFATARPTADPLTSTGSPRFVSGDVALVFNNALDAKTFVQHVKIAPSPRQVGQLYSLSDDGTAILVNPYALEPQRSYTFTFDRDLQDVYGQKLGTQTSVAYSTGNYSPYFWAPTGSNMFLASQKLKLEYSAVNVPGNRYRAAYRAIDPQTLANVDTYSAQDVLPAPGTWPAYSFASARNRMAAIDIPLRQKLGAAAGVLAYGATARFASAPSYFGMVQLTNFGIFAQWFPESGAIMVQHLSDGSPVSGAAVSVYVSHLFEPSPAPPMLCASGTTNGNGSLAISGTEIERCYMGNRPVEQAPQLFVVARSGRDWSFARTFDWSGVYTYGTGIGDATWSAGQPISRGTVFSDRELYQPGERGWFTAVCYILQNGTLRADRNARYTIRLRDPDGHESKLPPQTTNDYATFAFPIDFTKSQALGYYTIVAKSPDGAEITGNFRVAEFRPPNFSVDLKLDRDFAAAGDSLAAQGSAHYLFGAPMTGTATLHVTRQPAFAFTPKGWDDFTFGRQWFWPEQQPDISADAGQQNLTLDAQGNATARIVLGRDIPYAMNYRVDLEATDVSHLASSATQSFTALPTSTQIGLRSDFVGTVNMPINGSMIVTDPQGRSKPGTRVHIELQKMQYSGVTQIVEGSEAARNQVQYTTVAQTDLTSGTQAQTFSLQTKDAGSYRIRANLAGASDDSAATDAQVWVTGPGQAAWGEQNPSQLQLKLDKRSYNSTDTATVAVASPYDKADLYVSVVRDRVLYKTLVHVNGSAPRVRIPISAAMFPNAAVEGVLVRRGAAITGANAPGIDSLVRIGMVPLSIDLRPQYLVVKISPARAKLEPRARQRLHLQLSDGRGNAVKGQFTVIVANDAILQLSGYRVPDLVKVVLRDQPIATRFADNRPDVTLTQPSDVAQKGWGYGGGFLAGAANTRVRTQFLPLAYFNGAVQTNANGSADISFETPDNLTTWRIMAVALTRDARPRFGSSETTFITTKPLVTSPLLPQFARPGDRFEAGLSLMNASGSGFDARTQALLSGVLRFVQPVGKEIQAQQQFGPGLNAWRFPMTVDGTGSAGMQFRTLAGGNSDAFDVPLDIRTADVTESTIEAGATLSHVSVPLQIGSGEGTVRIDAAGSLLPQVVEAAKRAIDADRLMLCAPTAARLSIATSVLSLQSKLGTKIGSFDAAREAKDDIAQLAALQRIDGGFRPWPGAGTSDPFASADAVRALAYARDNGQSVPAATIVKAKAYLIGVLADPHGAVKWCSDASCKASLRLATLQALAALGDRRTDFLQSIYAQRGDLGITERIGLALYVQQTPGWQTQANVIAHEIDQETFRTGRFANVQAENVWSGSPVQAQAAYLRLLVIRNASVETQDGALRALISQQCRCGWPAMDQAAAALEAVVAYAKAERTPPRFTVDIVVDGKPAGSARFESFSSPAKTVTLPSLSPGSHTVLLRKSGSGTLHYVVAYDYRLAARSPGRLAGLRVRRTLRAANTTPILATMDIAPSAQSLALQPGTVYDVGVDLITDHAVDHVVITDPLPAGFEALDTSFQTTAAYYQPFASDWQVDYQQIYRDRVVAYAQHLDPGVYSLHYLVRSVTPGTYLWPGSSAYLLDAPEQLGRSAFCEIQIGS